MRKKIDSPTHFTGLILLPQKNGEQFLAAKIAFFAKN